MLKKAFTIILFIFALHSYTLAGDKLNIVTSIEPLTFFIETVGGEHVSVAELVPPGGNPHTYEPTPRQMSLLSRADLYVKVGSGIEFERVWMHRLEALNKKMPVCNASEGIELIALKEHDHDEAEEHHDHDAHDEHDHDHHGGKDPHIWLSPVNAIVMVKNIQKSLSQTDPANSAYYKERADNLVLSLTGLEKDIKTKLKNIRNRHFYIFHPAWLYFARDFNLVQVPVEYSGKEPTPERLTKLVKKAKKQNIKVIFSSPQFSRKSADVIAREIGGRVLFIDPMSKDYIKNLERTAELFQENL